MSRVQRLSLKESPKPGKRRSSAVCERFRVIHGYQSWLCTGSDARGRVLSEHSSTCARVEPAQCRPHSLWLPSISPLLLTQPSYLGDTDTLAKGRYYGVFREPNENYRPLIEAESRLNILYSCYKRVAIRQGGHFSSAAAKSFDALGYHDGLLPWE